MNITLPDRLAEALDAYIRDQEISTSTTDIVQAALEQYLTEKGYLPNIKKHLRITPATDGTGYRDTSINHDSTLAEQALKS